MGCLPRAPGPKQKYMRGQRQEYMLRQVLVYVLLHGICQGYRGQGQKYMRGPVTKIQWRASAIKTCTVTCHLARQPGQDSKIHAWQVTQIHVQEVAQTLKKGKVFNICSGMPEHVLNN